ncbi:peptide ABC transporter permease [Kiloniella spongiae]|uniref:Peptide ABC transporter permease n=1 Tax=Kiloniella spongiae TaxID=1489064 RepID=A0A0H2MGB5_9PROT|nr:ABC transporter permease [Kiloniella spongiae]KLN61599.1 peptide ABC transporter permease [Kiloniella spongiae]
MLSYILRRTGLALVITVLAVSLLFVIIHMIPGDPVSTMLGPKASPELRAALEERMGLNEPLLIQIGLFFANMLRGDLGIDVFSNRQVTDIVLGQVPYTLTLILTSIGWSAIIGIALGCYSAANRNSFGDRLTGVLSVSMIAVPAFVVSLYSLLFFAVTLKWFPAIGAGEPGDFGDQLWHLVLPSLAIGLSWVGYIARLVRASMLEIMGEGHVRTARAFGLPERWITYRYALRLAILPTVTVIGVGMGFLLSAAVFTEIVFSRPGLGKLVIDSITTRNYPVVMGSVLFSTLIFVASTTLADIINALLDPRLRSAR